jgi:hypothetical protein
MMDRLIDYWNSTRIDWHIERGLLVNINGQSLADLSNFEKKD